MCPPWGQRQAMAKAPLSAERAADHAAVEALSREFRPALVRYFERRGVPAMDAEDVAQDVFDRLARRQGVAVIEKLERYLFETAANAAVDYHRRAKVRGRTRPGAPDGDLRVNAKPVGVFVIKDGSATWVPAVDQTRIALLGELIGLVAATFATLAMVRRPPWPDLHGTVAYTKPR